MTDHATTNPPGPGNPPSSTSPADAGGAVQVAVPPAGRVTKKMKALLQEICTDAKALMDIARGALQGPSITYTRLLRLQARGLTKCMTPHGEGFAAYSNTVWSITDAGRLLLKEGK